MVVSKVTLVTVYEPSGCGSARSTERLSSSSASLGSMLAAFQGLVNQIRPFRSVARSLGVLSFCPSTRSAMVVVVPSGSKRTMERPPEQHP